MAQSPWSAGVSVKRVRPVMAPVRRVGLYLLDLDPGATSSPGIQRYSCRLVRELDNCPPRPGLAVQAWVSSAARDCLPADDALEWVKVRTVRGRFGQGWRRLLADHVLARQLAHRMDAVHFPKGWIPCPAPRRPEIMATVCDTIPLWYRQHEPRYAPVRMRYFGQMIRHSVRQADRIITISQASAAALGALAPRAAITVIPAGGFDREPDLAPRPRRGMVVMASPHPHKRTAETLQRLDLYAKVRSDRLPVTVIGNAPASITGDRDAFRHLDVHGVGVVTDAQRDALLRSAECLVFLSEIEGFGLPLLESYAVGTPVCYRAVNAAAEVMADAPGGWDGVESAGFDAALDAARHMPVTMLRSVAESLYRRYAWPAIAEATLDVYAAMTTSISAPDWRASA